MVWIDHTFKLNVKQMRKSQRLKLQLGLQGVLNGEVQAYTPRIMYIKIKESKSLLLFGERLQ